MGNKNLIINWNKFKINAKGRALQNSKKSYIEFCKMLDEIDFKLVSDYVGTMNKVELVYKFNKNIELNIKPEDFKRTYKNIINFKNNLVDNNDRFIKFVGLNSKGNFIVQIKAFDGGFIDLDISQYISFNKGRRDFYEKLKEVNGHTVDYYINTNTKMNIYIDNIKLNPMSPATFKRQTYKVIVNLKNNLKKNNDEFIKFVRLSSDGKLTVEIRTFDGGEIEIDIGTYSKFIKGRQSTYDYCKERDFKILSPYINADKDKMLIDFNCGHKPHWIIPHNLKQNCGCPICNISKGEKFIKIYLEKNNVDFIQEHRFDDCKYKKSLPFDFYIPKYNLCIEFDGEQHFKAFNHFGGKEKLKLTQTRDNIKNKYCKDNSINLLRIPYWEMDSIEEILDEEFKKLKELNNDLKEVI